MTARSRGISSRCCSTSSAGKRIAPGSFVSASAPACGLRVSMKATCSPLFIRSPTSSAVTLVTSTPSPPLPVPVFTLGGQPRLDPVGLAAGVVRDVRVPHRRQLTGGVLGGVSRRAGAVDDYLRALVRQQPGGQFSDPVGREVNRPGQVLVPVGHLLQRLDQGERLAPIHLPFKLLT